MKTKRKNATEKQLNNNQSGFCLSHVTGMSQSVAVRQSAKLLESENVSEMSK